MKSYLVTAIVSPAASASARGLIGPDAGEALPVRRELARIPRVQWTAEEAIRRVERQ